MYNRILKMNLDGGRSVFLWGARKTGKSTYLKNLFPNSALFDLLDRELQIRYLKEPFKLRREILELDQELLQRPIIIDEIQKVPELMDEIQLMIETHKLSFILCGSSARKMRSSNVNLLGGRALKYQFYPLVYPEISDKFDLLKIFNRGLIPSHYEDEYASEMLKSYVKDYLAYEVISEAKIRDIAKFTRFFDAAGFSAGEMVNYSNIARDVGINSATVKEHFQILVDMFIGHILEPYRVKAGRDIISSTPKFYFFDVGVANNIAGNTIGELKGIEAGRSLEQYIFLELNAYINLTSSIYKLGYWRTKTGLEVDFIAHHQNLKTIPVEVKISSNVHKTELKGLKAFMKQHNVKKGYVVSTEKARQKYQFEEGEIIIYPVEEFLQNLWDGKIIEKI